MSQNQLLAAREFILSKKYGVARAILEELTEDETAKTWLVKLDTIAPDHKSSYDQKSDEDLTRIINDDLAFRELFLRFFHYENDNSNLSLKLRTLSEFLCMNFDAESEEVVCRSLWLLSLFDPAILLNNKEKNIIAKIGELLESDIALADDRSFYAYDALSRIDTPEAKFELLAKPLGMTNGVIKLQTLSSRDINSTGSGILTQFRVFEDNDLLFSIQILKIKDREYKLEYPAYDIMTENLPLIYLVSQLADQELDKLYSKDLWQEEQERGHRTYIEDIAPYEHD